MDKRIKLRKGDITKLKTEAIVNAANTSLLGGGGVDGAIHKVAGPELLEECKTLGGCPTGHAKLTKAYNLPARYVIHTVGPVWQGGQAQEEQLLARCYKNSLIVAIRNEIKSVAFPNISTGVYGFPKDKAADIAIHEVCKFLLNNQTLEKVVFCVFDDENYQLYRQKLKERV